MEHNEYAVWTVKVKVNRDQREFVAQDETRLTGHQAGVETFTIVAPTGDLGRALMPLHLDRMLRYASMTPLPNHDRCYKLVSMDEAKLHGIVRYEDAYRGRL